MQTRRRQKRRRQSSEQATAVEEAEATGEGDIVNVMQIDEETTEEPGSKSSTKRQKRPGEAQLQQQPSQVMSRGEMEIAAYIPTLDLKLMESMITLPHLPVDTLFDLPLFSRRHAELLKRADTQWLENKAAAQDLLKFAEVESRVVEFYGGNFVDLINPLEDGYAWNLMADLLEQRILPLMEKLCQGLTTDVETLSPEIANRDMSKWCQQTKLALQKLRDDIPQYYDIFDTRQDQDYILLKREYDTLIQSGAGLLKMAQDLNTTDLTFRYAERHAMVTALMLNLGVDRGGSVYTLYFLAEVCCNIWDVLHFCLATLFNSALADSVGPRGAASIAERLSWVNAFGFVRTIPFDSHMSRYEINLAYARLRTVESALSAPNNVECKVFCPSTFEAVDCVLPTVDTRRLLAHTIESPVSSFASSSGFELLKETLLRGIAQAPYPLASSAVVSLIQLRLPVVGQAFQALSDMVTQEIKSDALLRERFETVSVSLEDQARMTLCPDLDVHYSRPLLIPQSGSSPVPTPVRTGADREVVIAEQTELAREVDQTSFPPAPSSAATPLQPFQSTSGPNRSQHQRGGETLPEKELVEANSYLATRKRKELKKYMDLLQLYKDDANIVKPLPTTDIKDILRDAIAQQDIFGCLRGAGLSESLDNAALDQMRVAAETSAPDTTFGMQTPNVWSQYIRLLEFALLSKQAILLSLGAALNLANRLASDNKYSADFSTGTTEGLRDKIEKIAIAIGTKVKDVFQLMLTDNAAQNLATIMAEQDGEGLFTKIQSSLNSGNATSAQMSAAGRLFDDLIKELDSYTSQSITSPVAKRDIASRMNTVLLGSKYFIGTIYMCLEKTLHLLSCLPFYIYSIKNASKFTIGERTRIQLTALFGLARAPEKNFWVEVYRDGDLDVNADANGYYGKLLVKAKFVYVAVPPGHLTELDGSQEVKNATNIANRLPYAIASLLSETFDMLCDTVEENRKEKILRDEREKRDKTTDEAIKNVIIRQGGVKRKTPKQKRKKTKKGKEPEEAEEEMMEVEPTAFGIEKEERTPEETVLSNREDARQYLNAHFRHLYIEDSLLAESMGWDPRYYTPLVTRGADSGGSLSTVITDDPNRYGVGNRFRLVRDRVEMFTNRFNERVMITAYMLHHLQNENRFTRIGGANPNVQFFTWTRFLGLGGFLGRSILVPEFINGMNYSGRPDLATVNMKVLSTIMRWLGTRGNETVGSALRGMLNTMKYATDSSLMANIVDCRLIGNFSEILAEKVLILPDWLSRLIRSARTQTAAFQPSRSSAITQTDVTPSNPFGLLIDASQVTRGSTATEMRNNRLQCEAILDAWPELRALVEGFSMGNSLILAGVGLRVLDFAYQVGQSFAYIWELFFEGIPSLLGRTGPTITPPPPSNPLHQIERESDSDASNYRPVSFNFSDDAINRIISTIGSLTFAASGGSELIASMVTTPELRTGITFAMFTASVLVPGYVGINAAAEIAGVWTNVYSGLWKPRGPNIFKRIFTAIKTTLVCAPKLAISLIIGSMGLIRTFWSTIALAGAFAKDFLIGLIPDMFTSWFTKAGPGPDDISWWKWIQDKIPAWFREVGPSDLDAAHIAQITAERGVYLTTKAITGLLQMVFGVLQLVFDQLSKRTGISELTLYRLSIAKQLSHFAGSTTRAVEIAFADWPLYEMMVSQLEASGRACGWQVHSLIFAVGAILGLIMWQQEWIKKRLLRPIYRTVVGPVVERLTPAVGGLLAKGVIIGVPIALASAPIAVGAASPLVAGSIGAAAVTTTIATMVTGGSK